MIGPEKSRHCQIRLKWLLVRRLKIYGESRIGLGNLKILKKILEKSSQFLSSEQPCEPKSLHVALSIAEVEKTRSENLRLQSTVEAI